MKFYQKGRFWLVSAIAIVALLIVQQIWHWEVERVEVDPGEFLVVVNRWGKPLDEDHILAPDASYQGVMLDVLPEGRHFINPILQDYESQKVTDVEKGTCLVLSRKFGVPIPAERIARGEILARSNADDPMKSERGIVGDVLLPGRYRLNPYAYSWELVNAVEVKVNEVGVRTLKVGKDPSTAPPDPERGEYLVPKGYRGVQQMPAAPGTYYINPFVETISPVEVRSHRVELGDIEFPSRDGFMMTPHVVVEYAVDPKMAPELLVRITTDGVLHQKDSTPEEQAENEILQKVILPHIRGYARIEGSNFDARDFILITSGEEGKTMTNAREALQKALLDKVKPRSEELGVEIRAVTLADLKPPLELSEQISQRELARVEREKNVVRIGQFKAEQELKAKESLKQQAAEKVEAETRLIQGKKKSEQLKAVEEARLKQELANTQLRLDAARNQAEAVLATGKAEAAVIHLQNDAEVAGLRTAMQGFGSPMHFAQYQILSKLSPALTEIFASDQSDFGRIFSEYMTPAAGDARPPVTTPATVTGTNPAKETRP
jgi:regulator of protease activity HflC (stomatin/prohibitin superfamily)